MYNIGTVTTTANSTKLVGTGTKWKENINLVLPMQMIQIQIGNTVHNNSIHSIQSNTELTLNFPLPTAQAGAKYVIFTTTMDSISAAANAIVAMNVSNVQFSDIQNRIMTESGVIDIKLPDGTVRKTRTEAERDKLLDGKFDKTSVVQSTGKSTTQVMSQGAATKLFIKPGDAGIGGSAERIYVDALASLQGKPSGFYHSGGDILNLSFSGQWHEFIKIMLTEAYGSLFSLSANNQVSTNVLNNGAWSGWATLFGESNTYTDHNNVIKKSNTYLSDYPVGSPIPWPQSAAPSGFLICNGQSFNKATYPLLAAAYPSGALPDLRGEFIRGFDSGRGVDASRTVLSVQGHALQGHGHTFAYNRTNTTEDNPGTGAAIHRESITLSATNRVGEPVTLAGFGEVKLATETRPRNIAYLYIVRAA